jgi:outer membrane protein assembly factor BamA
MERRKAHLLQLFVHVCLLSISCSFAVRAQELRDSISGSQIGFLPLPIFYYTPETGFAGGAAVLLFHRVDSLDREARPSTLLVDFIYTQKKQIIAEANPDVYLDKGRYRITGSITYIKYPQKFYGVGNNTPETYEEDYTSRAFRITCDAVKRVTGALSAGISVLYETRSLAEFEPGRLLEPGTLLGSRGGKTLGLGVVAQWDTRNNAFTPSEGRYCQFSLRSSSSALGSDFDFSSLQVDLREYFGVSETTVLAAQAMATLTNGSVPFHKLAELGGKHMMRGYYEGRYRDKKYLAAQVEYRAPVYWRIGMVLFAGAGDVASTLSAFRLRDLKPSYGFGLRYMFDRAERLNLRLDVGFGRSTSGFYITAMEAF